MKKIWLFLRPSYMKITLLVILTLTSSAITTEFEATSKVTWHANRGFPFPIMTIFEYVQGGRCVQNTLCIATNIQNFHVLTLLLNILVWYLVSCAVILGYKAVKKQARRQLLEP